MHGDRRIDYYNWLRDPDYPEVKDVKVLQYIEDENSYFTDYFAELEPLKKKLIEELKRYIKDEDYTIPIKYDEYEYYSYIGKDDQFWQLWRNSLATNEVEIVYDPNIYIQSGEFFHSGAVKVSHDEKMIAYSYDIHGSEAYDIVVRNIKTREVIDDAIKGNGPTDIVWHHNNKGFFYTTGNDTQRYKVVKYHVLGDNVANDQVIFEESKDGYAVFSSSTDNKNYLILASKSFAQNEQYYIDLRQDDFVPKLIHAMQANVNYEVEINDEYVYMLINDKSRHNRIVRIRLDDKSGIWDEIIPVVDGRYYVAFQLYKEHLVVQYKEDGLAHIEIFSLDGKLIDKIEFIDPVYEANIIFTKEDYSSFRYSYESLRQPVQVFAYDFVNKTSSLIYEREIPSGFDADKYIVERVWVDSRDGVKVPVSILYNTQMFAKDGSNKLYCLAYGSYGISRSDGFNVNVLTLVDRGYVFIIPHVRGESYLGDKWHDDGKLLNKKNTMNDVIDVLDYMVYNKYTSNGKISLYSGSAGGLITGYCVNERPELFDWVMVRAPFVDVINTMLDVNATPIASFQAQEFGDPKDERFYNYLMTYAPYDNLKAQHYPKQFITIGLQDPRVGYWEALKYVAKMRSLKKDNNILLLHIDVQAGHFGKMGRYDSLEDVAKQYALLLSE